MRDVRWRADDGWEGRCEACCDWYPIDRDFWRPSRASGLRRCLACQRDDARLASQRWRDRGGAKTSPAKLAADRARYAANIERERALQKGRRDRLMADPMYREERARQQRVAYAARVARGAAT